MTTTEPLAPETETRGVPAGWRGRLMPVNTMSGDRRLMTLDGDLVPTRPLPLAFNAQEKVDEGHDGAVTVGLITRVWLEAGFIWGEGPFDLADPVAYQWARKLGEGYAGWVSIDLSDAQVEEVPLDADGNEIPDEVFAEWERAYTEWERGDDSGDWSTPPPEPPRVEDSYLRVSAWKVMGATLVSGPAFEDARVFPVWDEFESTPTGPALVAAATETEHTGAMIALVPAETDALAVDGGDPAEELHLTLAYLGEAVDWTPDARAALTTAVGGLLGGAIGDGRVFGHARFNPGDPDKDECSVYLVDSAGAREMQAAVADVLATTSGLPTLPEQHPFIPHITAGYGLDISKLQFVGPVTFPKLRIAFAGEATDMLLDTEALAASAGVQYRRDDFYVPEPDHYVDSWQIDEDGRVSMHLAKWGECHIGYAGNCVAPPPGVAEYARFHRLSVDTDQGPLRVGKITMGTARRPASHAAADPGLSASAVQAHYDNTGTLVAVVRCVDGMQGPWLSGHLVPWATREQAQQLAHHEVSGDWRGPTGRLELVAALAVNVPGFMRSVAASGMEALVAAGRPMRTGPSRRPRIQAHPAMTREELRAEVHGMFAEFAAQRDHDARLAPHDARVRGEILARQDRRVRRGKWGTQQ